MSDEVETIIKNVFIRLVGKDKRDVDRMCEKFSELLKDEKIFDLVKKLEVLYGMRMSKKQRESPK